MQIPVNKNFDLYKDDFYKGLTLKQTLLSVLALGVGAGVFLLFFVGCGLPQSISLYLTLPVVFPIAASGFLKIHGMTLPVYYKKRKRVLEIPIYKFCPQMLQAASGTKTTAVPKPQNKKKGSAAWDLPKE